MSMPGYMRVKQAPRLLYSNDKSHNIPDDRAKFCQTCGAKVIMLKCPNCKRGLAELTRYCLFCGKENKEWIKKEMFKKLKNQEKGLLINE